MATIEKRGDSYRITVTDGYDIHGKQIRHRTTWTPKPGMTEKQIEKELNRVAVRFEDQFKGSGISGGNMRLADFAEVWFRDYAEKQLKPQTVADYRYLLPRVNAALGHLAIEKIQPRHILAFYDNLTEDGIRNDTKYACKYDFNALLEARGESAWQFSKRINMGTSTVYSLCKGNNVSRKTAERIADGLSMTVKELFAPISKGTLSGELQLHYHRFLSSMLDTAVQWQKIKSNPCSCVAAPKSDTKETAYLDEYQTAELIAALDEEPIMYRTAILLILNMGLRRGELCGLKWNDIDFRREVMSIRRNAVYIVGKGVILDTPKTKNSRRSLKIPSTCIPMLREYQEWQNTQRATLGDAWIDDDFIFTSWNGTIMRPDTLGTWFAKFIKRHNLPHITLHGLRHTNATLLIAAGTDLRTVANRLGHAQTSTTADIYAHAIQSADAAAAEQIGNILTLPKRPKQSNKPQTNPTQQKLRIVK